MTVQSWYCFSSTLQSSWIFCSLCLKRTIAIHYCSMTEDKKGATFSFSNFQTINTNNNAKICDLFVVYINLETKCIVEARLNDMLLTAKEALILCLFNMIASNDVKLYVLLGDKQWNWSMETWFLCCSSISCYSNVQLFGLHICWWILSRME